MSDLLRRLLARALGRAELVQPMVGTRFGREPELLSERAASGAEERPLALPAPAAEGAGKPAPRD